MTPAASITTRLKHAWAVFLGRATALIHSTEKDHTMSLADDIAALAVAMETYVTNAVHSATASIQSDLDAASAAFAALKAKFEPAPTEAPAEPAAPPVDPTDPNLN